MANRKYGGRTWSPEDDFKVRNADPFAAAGDRGSDETGAARGAQSQGSDDSAFLTSSQSQTNAGTGKSVKDIFTDVMNAPQGSGNDVTGGSGPIYPVGGGKSPPRYASNAGAKDNDSDGV